MDKNIVFLYKFLSNYFFCKNFDVSLLKSFISSYSENGFLKDKVFLDRVDLSSLKLSDKCNNVNYDYLRYLDSNKLKHSPKIILLNGCYLFSENINVDISINNSDSNFFYDLDSLNFKFHSDNLNFFYLLNSVLAFKHLFVKIPDNFVLKENLYILNFYDEALSEFMFHPSLFLNIGKNSNINIVESHINFSKKNFINASSILHLESSAKVSYNLFNYCKFPLLNSHSIFSFQNDCSNLSFRDGFFGKHFFKGFYNFYLYGRNAIFDKKSGRDLKYDSNFNLDCNIFHYASNTKSNTLFRVVGHDASKCFYRGSIVVGIDITVIDSDLKCDGLLLSELSNIVLIPELCIDNDDVKCSHGATIGCLYDRFIFYMMSRGISKSECVCILINGFLSKCIDKNILFFSILNDDVIENYYIY